jgi:hypothetical protein
MKYSLIISAGKSCCQRCAPVQFDIGLAEIIALKQNGNQLPPLSKS